MLMAIRRLRDAAEAKKLVDAMTDHSYDVRSVGHWLVDKISELEKKIAKLENDRK
jgi:hypothetical protein